MKFIPLLLLCGCVWPGTDLHGEYDPETKKVVFDFERGWLAGPFNVDAQVLVESPDGTKVTVKLKQSSDTNLDSALQARLEQEKNLAKALDLAAAAASGAAGP